jgi:hypothetical protein
MRRHPEERDDDPLSDCRELFHRGGLVNFAIVTTYRQSSLCSALLILGTVGTKEGALGRFSIGGPRGGAPGGLANGLLTMEDGPAPVGMEVGGNSFGGEMTRCGGGGLDGGGGLRFILREGRGSVGGLERGGGGLR